MEHEIDERDHLCEVDSVIWPSDRGLHFSYLKCGVSKPVCTRTTFIEFGETLQVMTYDRLSSPSRLKSSIIRNISILPSLASTFRPPILMLTFSSLRTMRSLLSNRCRILRQTKTPQSDPFSCEGLSSNWMKRRGFPSRMDIWQVANFAFISFPGGSES